MRGTREDPHGDAGGRDVETWGLEAIACPRLQRRWEEREIGGITKSKYVFVLETFYSIFSPLRALSRPARSA